MCRRLTFFFENLDVRGAAVRDKILYLYYWLEDKKIPNFLSYRFSFRLYSKSRPLRTYSHEVAVKTHKKQAFHLHKLKEKNTGRLQTEITKQRKKLSLRPFHDRLNLQNKKRASDHSLNNFPSPSLRIYNHKHSRIEKVNYKRSFQQVSKFELGVKGY